MRALAACAMVLTAGTGCVGNAPRERPVLEPPALPMSQEEPETSEASPNILGAWSSVSFKGPGSASYHRIDWIFCADGRYLSVGEGQDGAKVVLGQYAWNDGVLTLARSQGTTLRFDCLKEGPMLVLKDRSSELRLARIRP